MVRALDEQFLNVTSALERAGYLNNTMIIFTNENPAPTPPTGPNATFTAIGGSNYPQRGSKHTLWGDGVAYVWGAGVPPSARGSKTRAMMHAVDLFQLAVQTAGAGNRSSVFPLDGGAPARVWDAIRGLSDDKDAVRNETLLNYDPLATPGPKGCCGYAGLVWAEPRGSQGSDNSSSASSQRQWKLLVDPGQPDGWYPPGSSQSVPPSEAGIQGLLPGVLQGSPSLAKVLVPHGPHPDPDIPTGPPELRGFPACASGVVALATERAQNEGVPAMNLAETVDRECNALRRMDQWELLRREQRIRWGDWGSRLVQEISDRRAGRTADRRDGAAESETVGGSSPSLIGRDGFVRLGPDARITQLFELESDPYQEHDVIQAHPDVAQKLLARLDEYIAQSMPDGHGPGRDPQANPINHGGYWTPWLGPTPSPHPEPLSQGHL